jgi:hypothetical protein
MNLNTLLKEAIIGESVIREFMTVGIGDSVREKVYLKYRERVSDITGRQWLLALDPRVLGVWVERGATDDTPPGNEACRMYFLDSAPADAREVAREAVAELHLEPFTRIEEKRGTLVLMKVTNSAIRHVPSWKARLLYARCYKKPGFPFDKLKAVAAAYSYPRRVRIISFKESSDYNYIFPMDLLADISQAGLFLFGMRHSNRVLSKVTQQEQIVVSEVAAELKPLIYQLGKNHSASPPPLKELPFATIQSREFGVHIPDWAESYKELYIRRTLDLGSHMLLLAECAQETDRKPATPRLHHIHFLHFLHLKSEGLTYPTV